MMRYFVRFLGIVVLLLGMTVQANSGSLEPTAPPGPTMHTLGEIYDKVDALAAAPEAIPSVSVFDVSTGINLSLIGMNQGEIQGSCTIPGRENSIIVTGFEHRVSIPRDPNTGLPTGQRVHGPITIVKYRDKSTPHLFQAECTGERLTSFVMKFYRKNTKGTEEHYFTITLQNAMIIDAELSHPDIEKFTFTYEKIIWTYVPEGIEFEDSWMAPKV